MLRIIADHNYMGHPSMDEMVRTEIARIKRQIALLEELDEQLTTASAAIREALHARKAD